MQIYCGVCNVPFIIRTKKEQNRKYCGRICTDKRYEQKENQIDLTMYGKDLLEVWRSLKAS